MKQRKRIFKKGERFGLLTLLEISHKTKQGNVYKCKCDCGNIYYVRAALLGKKVKSCGCLKYKDLVRGFDSRERLYGIWYKMKDRCYNPQNARYKDYGGRGITMDPLWLNDYLAFKQWAVNNGYENNLTIERINNNGGYFPDNCEWIPLRRQVLNRRPYGEIPYEGIVKDNSGYRAQITVNGEKRYIAHSVDDIMFLVKKRNEYIISHNLPHKITPI